jgi:class 3 adenylate cyclase
VKSARQQAVQNVADWLEDLGMSEYAQRFAENRIDFSVLPDLTDQDLKDLGVVLGDRRKMLRAIAKLDATPEAVTLTPKPASAPSVAAVQPVPVAEESSGRHHVTVMLCDLVDSTHLAAKLDPEEWRERVDAYLDAASAAVTEMGGKVAKKLAYGLLALFGYPAAQENDSERAVRAALATQRALTELNRINVGRPALAAGIVIDSGPVVIDAAGPIFGEVSNIVAQAQALAGPGAVVVTARVQRQVAGLFVVDERGSHRLKDVPEAVTLYRVVRATSGEHPRPNYHRLIVRAVNGLDMSTAEARQAVYERARKAAVAQLSFNQLALSKEDIAKECLALEEAIRKVEADAARKSRTQTPAEPRSATPPAGAPDGGAQAASRPPQRNRANPPPAHLPWAGWPTELPDAREQLLSGRDAYEEEAPQYPAEEPAASSHKFEPHLDSEYVNSVDSDTWQERDLELAYEPEEEYERTRPALSYGGLVRLLVVLIILAGVVGDGILAVVHDHGILPILQPHWNEASKPGQPKNAVSAIKILGPRSAGARYRTGARGAGAGRASGAGRRAAGCAARGGPERPAGQTLHGLRHVAYGNSFARRWTIPRTYRSCRRGNSRTENDRGLVVAPQCRQGSAGQPHDRDQVQPAGRFSRRRHC